MLFPGMVSVEEGVIVSPLPDVLAPIQNVVVFSVTPFKVNGLLPEAPVELFHVTWTLETVIAS